MGTQRREPEVFVHIGMHKAASSFLQRGTFDVLGRAKKILYFDCYWMTGDPQVVENKFVHEIHDKFQTVPYYTITDEYRDKVDRELAMVLEECKIQSNKVLISNEYLVGAEAHNFFADTNPIMVVRKMFKKPKIIFIIRKQDDFLESWYANQVRSGRWDHINQVLNYYDGELRDFKFSFRLNLDVKQLSWNAFVDHLEELFGAENVLVVPLELLRKDPKRFVESVTNFMGVEFSAPAKVERVNVKFPFLTLWLIRFVNRLTNNGFNGLVLLPQSPLNIFLRKWAFRPFHDRPKWIRKLIWLSNMMKWVYLLWPIGKLIPIKGQFIKDEVCKKIMAHHSPGNRLLDERRKLGLKEYGYY